jgi:alginate O-acetyltransferase complex protein AlgI
MLFNSFVFAGIFLPLTLLLFWGVRTPEARRAVLLASSLVFYGYWFPWYLLLLVGFVAIAWYCALQVEAHGGRKPVVVASVLLLGALAYYKYSGFLGQVFIDLGLLAHYDFRIQTLALPLGISFIVFQALGYVVDVYRREFPAEKSFLVVLLFKAFFPQLIAGPICRAHELMPQLRGAFTFRLSQFTSGLAIFSLGLLLKELFADGLAPLVNQLYASRTTYTLYESWAASIGFGGQIYADFWGYSTMAVGLARMFGVNIPTNFNMPYAATSLREFWRRWHITLSEWLRDYLYKPLGGSRKGPTRTVIALMLTMLLGGLWHGANYTFIVWGAIHGIALALEHMFAGRQRRTVSKAITLIRVAGWLFFRATDVQQGNQIVAAMFMPGNQALSQVSVQVQQIAFFVVILACAQWPVEWLLRQLRGEKIAPSFAIVIAFWSVVGAVVLGAPVAVPFIYFQF